MSARVAWVSLEPPDRFGGGGARRQFFQIEALQDHLDVDVVLPQSGELMLSKVGRLTNRLSSKPRVQRSRYDRRLVETVMTGSTRAAVVAHAETALRVPTLFQRAPTVVDLHNVYSRYFRLLGRHRLARQWSESEQWIGRSASGLAVVSDEEATSLELPRKPMVLEHGIAPAEWPAPDRRSSGLGLCLFGSWSHTPNVSGLAWFAAEVWPQVRRHKPDASLHLYGPGPAPQLEQGMHFHGRAADLAAAIHRHRGVIVPITEGVGSRVKFIEGLASGRPVVTTPAGAEGYSRLDQLFQVAESAAEFAEACLRTLDESNSLTEQSQAARQLVLSTYSWAATTRPMIEFLTGLDV